MMSLHSNRKVTKPETLITLNNYATNEYSVQFVINVLCLIKCWVVNFYRRITSYALLALNDTFLYFYPDCLHYNLLATTRTLFNKEENTVVHTPTILLPYDNCWLVNKHKYQ